LSKFVAADKANHTSFRCRAALIVAGWLVFARHFLFFLLSLGPERSTKPELKEAWWLFRGLGHWR